MYESQAMSNDDERQGETDDGIIEAQKKKTFLANLRFHNCGFYSRVTLPALQGASRRRQSCDRQAGHDQLQVLLTQYD